MIRRFALPMLAVWALALTACDPCAGTLSCTTAATVRASGRIVSSPAGTSAPGVRVTITAGESNAEATSDGDGFWALEFAAPTGASGQVTASADVQAPGASSAYHVDGLVLPVTRRRGDGIDLGRWYSEPQLRFIGELHARFGIDLTNATVQADRTGGVDGDVNGVKFNVGTGNQFYIEGPARAMGKMTLRLTISGPKFPVTYVRSGVQAVVMYKDTIPRVQGTYAVGNALLYVARVYRRGTDSVLAGVTGVFRRRSGVAVTVDSVKSVSTADGLVSLQLIPKDAGEVVGDLELRPPAPLPARTITGIRLSTVDDDSLRLGGVYGVGAQVRYAFDLFRRTSFAPADDVAVEFRPTSGPLTTVLSGRTNASGTFGVTAPVNSAGTVVGDLTVRYLDPRPPETRTGLRLIAAADDSVRYGGYLGIGPSLLYVGSVQDAITWLPITSGTAEFRRTSGVAVEQAVFSWPITADGYFRIAPTPLADGEVVGDLTLRLSAPYRDTTFTNIHLATFTADSGRAAPVFRVSRP